MNNRNDIQKELQSLNSNLPPLPSETYTVPEGYFEGFAASVLAKIRGEQMSVKDELQALSPLLAGISNKKTPFSLPDNYFEQNLGTLPGLLDEAPLPAVLLQAGKAVPYKVPERYFDELPGKVLERVAPAAEPPAKVVPMRPARWMRLAAAAAVAGVIVLGGSLFLNKDQSTADLVSQPQKWIANKLKNVSNQELERFIKNTDINSISGTETASGKMAGTTEVRKLLHDVSDTELDAFLDQVPAGTEEDLSVIN